MKQVVCFCLILQAAGLVYAEVESMMTLNHPDKNGYQSGVAGTDKHKYGYELKDNKHFHHTTTEKDGVRLGCYGYELEGKKYSTQYVADSRGYRIVSNQDLITVYPKSGGTRKASFVRNFDEDPSLSTHIRYFFPDGCKGIDVLIDNSSRLRAIPPDVHAKLPVTLKSTTVDSYVYSTPPESYKPPGPLNIYANQFFMPTARPPIVYLPPETTAANVYLPPVEDQTTVETPTNTYLPPVDPAVDVVSEDPLNTYLPPEDPTNVYLPPEDSTNVYLPPEDPSNVYLPPSTHSPKPTISQEIIPPELPDETCQSSLSCCEEASQGKFIIPIPLKSRGKNGCCTQVAKLILPTKGFDEDTVRKLAAAMTEEIDATELVKNILKNLL